ncbi:MAG TPA: hypothetical protein VJS44_17795 [Pyrinomonadaceae bacterium]|nr:hypothetical protein [Pyrinomonadaceae bacterium]
MKSKLRRGQFCGSLLSKREVGKFTLTEYLYPPELSLAGHLHEQAYFSLVLQGRYSEEIPCL